MVVRTEEGNSVSSNIDFCKSVMIKLLRVTELFECQASTLSHQIPTLHLLLIFKLIYLGKGKVN
jgi:hypothetical protein